MNNTSNLAVMLMAGSLSLGLYGCGGGGGGDSSTDTTTDTSTNTEILVDSPQKLADAISFEGAQEITGNIPAPSMTTGGTLDVATELSLTAGGTSALSVTPTVEEGYYVHAYMVQIEGTNKTFVIPVGPDGKPYGSTSTKPSASEVLKNEGGAMVSYAPTERPRVQLNCTGQPNMKLTAQPMDTSGFSYSAPAKVQSYIQYGSPPSFTPPTYDFSSLVTTANAWSEPANVDIKVTDVGSGNFQITLTWDTATDVDLHLEEPGGYEIYWLSPNSTLGDGYLDVDDLDGFGPENIYFDTNIPSGNYTVKVKMFNNYGITSTNYSVTVKRNGQTQSYSGTLLNSGEIDNIVSFTL